MLVNMNELLSVAARGHFAVPAFNISSYAMFNGIMDISEQKSAPVIIEIHPNELKHIGSDAVAGMVKRAGISTVPVAIHLDHGSSLSDVMAAIRAGFTPPRFPSRRTPRSPRGSSRPRTPPSAIPPATTMPTRAAPRFPTAMTGTTCPVHSTATSRSRPSSATSA